MFSRAINFLYLLNQIRFNSWSSIMYESIMRIPIGHDQNKPILFLMKLVHFFFFVMADYYFLQYLNTMNFVFPPFFFFIMAEFYFL